MSETELLTLLMVLEAVTLFGVCGVVMLVLGWVRRKREVSAAQELVEQVKQQERQTVANLREQFKTVGATVPQKAARKIMVKQHFLLAEIIEMFLNRDRKSLVTLPERINEYTELVLEVQKPQQEAEVERTVAGNNLLTATKHTKLDFSNQSKEVILEER